MTPLMNSTAWESLKDILFKCLEERQKGLFIRYLYQETIDHAVNLMNGKEDDVSDIILLCCAGIVWRILDEHFDEYFEYQSLRFPKIEDDAKSAWMRYTKTHSMVVYF